jgi:hypothetical protein
MRELTSRSMIGHLPGFAEVRIKHPFNHAMAGNAASKDAVAGAVRRIDAFATYENRA